MATQMICPYCNIDLKDLWRMFPPCRQEVTYMPEATKKQQRDELILGGCLNLTGKWDEALKSPSTRDSN